MKASISDKVFDKINVENISIKPRSYFKVIAFLWMLSAALLFIFGVFNFLLFFYSLESSNQNFQFGNFLTGTPLVGLLAGIFFIYIASRFYRRGRICCRHEEWELISSLLALAFIVGVILFNLKMIQPADTKLLEDEGLNIENKN